MDDVDYRRIAAGAELLQERIRRFHTAETSEHRVEETRCGDPLIENLEEHFDVSSEDLRRHVRFDRWPADEKLPGWTATFSNLMDYLSEGTHPVETQFECAVPFVDVFVPILTYCRRSFDAVDTDHLTDSARCDLEILLLDRLADVGAQALHVDFMTYIAEHDPEVFDVDRRSPDSTSWYDEYVSAVFDGRATRFFETYPVLARLVAIVVQQWQTQSTRFISRLNDDYDAIRSLFNVDDLGRVTGVEPAGDAHEGGGRVVVVAFESGDEVVYKPRDVEPEERFYGFLSWLGRRWDDFPDLQAPDLLSRSTYGWVEKVDSATFESVEALAEYYRRAGALLCVLYVVNAHDCHYENVVAGTKSPVVIDAETILESPIVEPPAGSPNERLRWHAVKSSVLKTNLLPYGEGTSSGLARIEEREGKLHDVHWVHVNSDAMDIEYRPTTARPEHNYPTYAGDPAPPCLFIDEILDGFEAAYDLLAEAREEVTRRAVRAFSGVRVRTVLRRSSVYQAIRNTLTSPTHLRDGVEYGWIIRRMLLESNDRSIGLVTGTDGTDAILAAETASVSRRDVPKFTTVTDDHTVYFEGEEVYVADESATGLDRMRRQMNQLSADDKARQRGLIRACLDETDTTTQRQGSGHV